MNDKINDLRALITDENLPLTERSIAAEYLMQLLVEAVPQPEDNDTEIVELMRPWQQDTEAEKAIVELFGRLTGGRAVNGMSLPDARAKVLERHRLRILLATVCDAATHRLEKIAACEAILEKNMPPSGRHRRNGYGPEQLLSEVLAPGTLKPGRLFKERVPVNRPPQSLSDVWEL